MFKADTGTRKRLKAIQILFCFCLFGIICRLFYIQFFESDWLQEMAYEQQTRDRLIKANRGAILDRNNVPIATTETVASISVVHSQIEDFDLVNKELSQRLGLSYEYVSEKTKKNVALERIKTKVDKNIADEIRDLNLKGVMIDEDIKRVYPYSTLASQVIGFVGKDNQGIIGLEAKYDEYLKGDSGKILTETDARGIRMKDGVEERQAPVNGLNLVTTIDLVMQQYAEHALEKAMINTNAKRAAIIVMDPNNGGILAMANEPDFDLNDPFTINNDDLKLIWDDLSEKERGEALNMMWRNFTINDTYEPGSTFKVLTSVAGLEDGVVTEDTEFTCNGYHVVAGRKIKCWRSPKAHGLQNFIEGVKNSCNPVFMIIAEQLGAERFYQYLDKFRIAEKTGVDLPGEASGILHKEENVGPLELATMSFGQSFQITPLRLITMVSESVNDGHAITPHFAKEFVDDEGNIVSTYDVGTSERVISEETSLQMREILEEVVYSGTGNKTYIPGYKVGGKTATSEKLPRGNRKYIASFVAFAPAENPEVIALVLIDEPQGAYYGGQIAGPVMKDLMENALPYLKVPQVFNDEEKLLDETKKVEVPYLVGLTIAEAKQQLNLIGLELEVESGEYSKDGIVIEQFPRESEIINYGEKIIVKSSK